MKNKLSLSTFRKNDKSAEFAAGANIERQQCFQNNHALQTKQKIKLVIVHSGLKALKDCKICKVEVAFTRVFFRAPATLKSKLR